MAVSEASDAPPNIIIIMTDDQGYGDLRCYGSRTIQTPCLDRLAREGVMLTDFHSAAPICTPSRAALLTGRYAYRSGLSTPLHTADRHGLSSEECTLAEILKTQGYHTACFGKWHLGHHPEFYPTRHGFDEYYGTLLGHCFRTESFRERGDYSDLFLQGERKIDFPPDESLTRRFTDEAIQFIERNRDRPFFLFLAHCMPHFPLSVSEHFRGKSEAGLYGDVIACLDYHVGRIYHAVDRCGIGDQTLILFLSDNGAEKKYGGSNRPFRGWKHDAWEGGHRVPCIIWGPGPIIDGSSIPGGLVCRKLVTAIDLLPTLTSLAGAELPEQLHLDGYDLRSLLKGDFENLPEREPFFLHVRHGKIAGVRTDRWKLLIPCKAGPYRQMGWKLYDLLNDPGETENLADRFPRLVVRFQRCIEQHRDDLASDPRLSKIPGQ
jgi:arylsulfatase A-like enzyme